jgi:hypothetical protein
LLSEDKKMRCAGLERVFATRPLLPEEQESWRGITRIRPLADWEFVLLMTAIDLRLKAFPKDFADRKS